MNSPRPSSRRDYRHFPEAYTTLLLQFDRDGGASLGPMSARDARAAVRDLYRFKMFLSHGTDADPEDEHARAMLRIFAKVILRIEPVAVTSPDDASHVITLQLNPIVAAMERTS
jgi:hypothetical protein